MFIVSMSRYPTVMLAQPYQKSFFSCAAPSRIQSAKNTPRTPCKRREKSQAYIHRTLVRVLLTLHIFIMFWKASIVSAPGRGRTGTSITRHGILSPRRLPIPPLGQVNKIKERTIMVKSGTDLSVPETTQIGLEPTASAVTGRRSNQLSHWALLFY